MDTDDDNIPQPVKDLMAHLRKHKAIHDAANPDEVREKFSDDLNGELFTLMNELRDKAANEGDCFKAVWVIMEHARMFEKLYKETPDGLESIICNHLAKVLTRSGQFTDEMRSRFQKAEAEVS